MAVPAAVPSGCARGCPRRLCPAAVPGGCPRRLPPRLCARLPTGLCGLHGRVDQPLAPAHRVEVELGGREAGEVRVLDEAARLRPVVVLDEVRQRAVTEAERDPLPLHVLLADARDHLRDERGMKREEVGGSWEGEALEATATSGGQSQREPRFKKSGKRRTALLKMQIFQ